MKHVLILDNDPDVLDIMQEGLNYEGLQVTCDDGAKDIFELIERHKPDLLMVDYLLNGIDGGEICKRVKENSQTHDLPVIIMSAYPRRRMSPDADACDDFIEKPFDLDDIAARIGRLIKKGKKRVTNAT